MRKIFIVIIIAILLITAVVFYVVYTKQSAIKNAGAPGTPAQENKETSGGQSSAQGIPLPGKVLGLSQTTVIIAKEGGGVETLEISGATPVFETDGVTPSGMGAVQIGKKIEVSYDEAAKKVVSITLLEK